MREILFRGIDKSTCKWVYGDLLQRDEGRKIKAIMPPYPAKKGIVVKEDSIGQYTGLTDKNGTKIFEGDILKGRFYGFPVIKDDFVFSVSWQDDVKGFKANYFEANLCEVIGNIHDNPELLEIKNE